MIKIEAIIKPYALDKVREALAAAGVTGLTVYEVKGAGHHKQPSLIYRGAEYPVDFTPNLKLEAVVPDELADKAVDAAAAAAKTGKLGDGKIFTYPIGKAVRIRTGQSGTKAL